MSEEAYILAFFCSLLLVAPPATCAKKAESVAEANNKFALDLYRKLVLNAPEENVVFSPLGVTAALSLTLLGMEGKAAENVRQILHLDELGPQGSQHASFRTILKILESTDNGAEAVSVVNRLFLDDDYKPIVRYEEDSLKFYATVPELIEFEKEKEARKRINNWLRDELGSDSKDLWRPDVIQSEKILAVLASAMTFKGTWLHKFKEDMTKKFEFHRGPGDWVYSSMMIQHDCKYRVAYDPILHAQFIELPYAGNKMTMVLAVPNDISGLAQMESKLNYESFARVRDTMRERSTDVFVPKFRLEQTWNLKDALWSLGLRNIFIPGNAEMNLLSEDSSLAVSFLLHKAVLEVDERGQHGPYPFAQVPDRFVANRPFLFFIEDNKSGAISFMGRVRKPTGPPEAPHDEL